MVSTAKDTSSFSLYGPKTENSSCGQTPKKKQPKQSQPTNSTHSYSRSFPSRNKVGKTEPTTKQEPKNADHHPLPSIIRQHHPMGRRPNRANRRPNHPNPRQHRPNQRPNHHRINQKNRRQGLRRATRTVDSHRHKPHTQNHHDRSTRPDHQIPPHIHDNVVVTPCYKNRPPCYKNRPPINHNLSTETKKQDGKPPSQTHNILSMVYPIYGGYTPPR